MAIQARRGIDADFDKSKMLAGEFAVSTDEKKAYVAFAPGDTKQLATKEDYDSMINACETATSNANIVVSDFRQLEIDQLAINDGVVSTESGWSSDEISKYDTKDNVVSFLEAVTRENILTGEKHSVIFGKIKKNFSDFKNVAYSGSFKDIIDKPCENVKSYGATGNGTTDDSTAFTNALSSSITNGNYIYVPNGTYLVSENIIDIIPKMHGQGKLKFVSETTTMILPLDVILDNITIYIPTFFDDFNDVSEKYLKYVNIYANVTVSVADGTYDGNFADILDKNYGKVSIIGNIANPSNCVINIGANTSAFCFNCSRINKIDGFRIHGTTRDNTDLITNINTNVAWSGINNIGIVFYNNAVGQVGKHMLIDCCYYGLQAVFGATVHVEQGDTIDVSTIVSNLESNPFYYIGHNLTIYNTGDVALHSYANSTIIADGVVCLCSKNEDNKLGFGAMAEDDSYLRIYNSYFMLNWSASLVSQAGSHVMAQKCYIYKDAHYSVHCYNSSMTLDHFSLKNTYGGLTAIGSNIKVTSGTCELNSNHTQSCYDFHGSNIILYGNTNAYGGLYGFYFDANSNIINDNYMQFLGNGNTYDWYKPEILASSTPVDGTFPIGMRVINTNPTVGGSIGWVNTSNGWKSYGTIEN